MRSIHIVPRIISEASGPAYSVMALCQSLNDAGEQTTLGVLDPAPDKPLPEFVKVFPTMGKPHRLGRSGALHQWLRASVRAGEVDIVHNHSLWMMPNIYPGWATRGTDVPLIVAPRGTLSTWALNRSKWTKRLFWTMLQQSAIRHTACFHATAESEYEEIRRAGFRQPVCIIPNGIDIPEAKSVADTAERPRRLLFLSRIHPKKGIENLLRAWAIVEPGFPDWVLDIVGPDNDGHLGQMMALANNLRIKRVSFRGPAYGADKLRAYRSAELYVLPTHSENFGMTVAEALAAGTPAIVTQGAPWSGLETRGAGWWIEIGVDPLIACLEDALACSPNELAVKGAAGRQWMQEEFSWRQIGGMMQDTYRWLLDGGSLPAWMRT